MRSYNQITILVELLQHLLAQGETHVSRPSPHAVVHWTERCCLQLPRPTLAQRNLTFPTTAKRVCARMRECPTDLTWLNAMTLPRASRFGTAPPHTMRLLKLRWCVGVQPSELPLSDLWLLITLRLAGAHRKQRTRARI